MFYKGAGGASSYENQTCVLLAFTAGWRKWSSSIQTETGPYTLVLGGLLLLVLFFGSLIPGLQPWPLFLLCLSSHHYAANCPWCHLFIFWLRLLCRDPQSIDRSAAFLASFTWINIFLDFNASKHLRSITRFLCLPFVGPHVTIKLQLNTCEPLKNEEQYVQSCKSYNKHIPQSFEPPSKRKEGPLIKVFQIPTLLSP